jgi:hypothetical protein
MYVLLFVLYVQQNVQQVLACKPGLSGLGELLENYHVGDYSYTFKMCCIIVR